MELSITYPDRVNDAGCHQNGGVALIGQMLSSCSEGGGARGHPAVMVVQSPSASPAGDAGSLIQVSGLQWDFGCPTYGLDQN